MRRAALSHVEVRHDVKLRTPNAVLVLKFLSELTTRSGKRVTRRRRHPAAHVILHAGVEAAGILRKAMLLRARLLEMHRVRMLLELHWLLHHLVRVQRRLTAS